MLKQRKNAWSGVSTYRALMELEGPHRESLAVQAAMISNVYFPLRKTEAMLQVGLNLGLVDRVWGFQDSRLAGFVQVR